MKWNVRRSVLPEPDRGAVAVEFALMVPIFVMLTFGALSAGTIYWHTISASQAVRDAARYGSTLPMSTLATPPPNTYTVDDWLTAVTQVALREAGIGDNNSDGAVDGADAAAVDAQVCAAFVKGTTSTHLLATKSKITGGGTGPASTAPCIALDGAPPEADRVQVLFKRDERFDAIFLGRNVTPQSTSVQPYQRVIP